MKTIVITGGNSGLGLETAKKCAKEPDTELVLLCRNPEKAENAKREIIKESGNENVSWIQADTSSLASVKRAADALIASGKEVSVLINNAGVSAMGVSGTTEEGFELVFATNYLGHFLLTQLLLPHMAQDARILNISSDMHNPPGPGKMEWPGTEAVAHPKKEDRARYSYSKLAMIYFAHELTKRLQDEGSGIIVNAFNPGFMADTNFTKGGGKMMEKMVKKTMPDRYGTLEDSSTALSAIALDAAFAEISGAYYDRSTNTARSSELSYNEENALELYEKSMAYSAPYLA